MRLHFTQVLPVIFPLSQLFWKKFFNFELSLVIYGFCISDKITFNLISLDPANDRSTLV